MFTNDARFLVKKAIQEETINAKKTYGTLYHSFHEGYAVTKEEIEEVEVMVNGMKHYMADLWESVKADNVDFDKIEFIHNSAFYAAMECLQVCACCNKMMGKEEVVE